MGEDGLSVSQLRVLRQIEMVYMANIDVIAFALSTLAHMEHRSRIHQGRHGCQSKS